MSKYKFTIISGTITLLILLPFLEYCLENVYVHLVDGRQINSQKMNAAIIGIFITVLLGGIITGLIALAEQP